MNMIKHCCLFINIIFVIGCGTPHTDFIKDMDNKIGYVVPLNIKPYKNKHAGELYRAGYVKTGDGLTHITKDQNRNIVIHIFHDEILDIYPNDDMVGKCLTYQVVDSKTGSILKWGFDEGGNPKSCVAWWP